MTTTPIDTALGGDAAARRRVLGWGIRAEEITPRLDHGRDIALARRPAGTDVATVAGVDCLAQGLAMALTTLRGSDPLDSRFGFEGLAALAEESTALMAQERLRVSVIATVTRDRRVVEITDVKVADSRLESPEPGSRELGVRVAFTAASGDRVVIDLGRLDSSA